MRHFIIDGNNLIGKIASLHKLQQKDKQSSREKLAFILESYFQGKPNNKVSLHYDGFEGQSIRLQRIRIIYSGKRTADDEIKSQIEQEKNRRTIIVISSDRNLKDFASVCGCDCMSCEDFAKDIMNRSPEDEEKQRQNELNNDNDEFKRLFNA
jgi:predicted RNA-binding protein with PIN domain